MSRKGHNLNNSLIENFLEIMKSEMFHRQEKLWNNRKSKNNNKWIINYYIPKRIKVKGLTPHNRGINPY